MDNKVIAAVIVVILIIAGVGIYYYYYATPPPPKEKQVLRMAIASGIANLDPHNYGSTPDLIVTSQITETLTEHNMDMTEIVPGLATSWEAVGSDSWRFYLRQNVKFHDGTPFNASVVKYNYERLLDEDKITGGGGRYVRGIMDTITAEDEYTVLIKCTGPIPYLPVILAEDAIGMVSPSSIETHGETYPATHPVGTGPFIFGEWVSNEYVSVVKNDEYWGTEPQLDEVIFRLIPEESARFLAFLAGEVDAVSNVGPEYVPQVEDNADTELWVNTDMRMVWMMVNLQREPFGDLKVRQAIMHAIDRDTIVENILENLGTPATVIAPPGVANRLPESEVGPNGIYPYDPGKSRELLAEAGWVDTNGDGIVEKDGQPLEFDFITPDGRYLKDKEMATAAAEMLREVGIKANIQIMETAGFFAVLTAHEWDMALLGFGWGGDMEPICRSIFYTYGTGVATWSSWSGPEAEQTDALFDEGKVEMDPEQRKQDYWDAQRIILESGMMQPIYFTKNIYGIYSYVKNFHILPHELPIFTDTYLEK